MRCLTDLHTESQCAGQDTHSQVGRKKAWVGGCGRIMGRVLAPVAQSVETFG